MDVTLKNWNIQYKKIVISTLLFMFFGMTGQAQTALSVTSDNASSIGGTVCFTVGQFVYTTNTGSDGSVIQGVQQPFEISIVSGMDEGTNINLVFFVYPNPTTDLLTLRIDGELKAHYVASLFDSNGKLLKSIGIDGSQTTIDMKNLVPAIYILRVTSNNNEIKIFKIIKQL